MKTKEQVVKYTSQCRFSAEDWQKILNYYREHFGNGRIRQSLKPLSDSTYQQFLDWINNGYGTGDIVRYGHTIGIVGACTPNYTCLAAYLSFDKQLIDQVMVVPGYKLIQSTSNDRTEIQDILKSLDLKFSVASACLIKPYQPKDGDIVRVVSKGEQTTAIFHRKENGDVHFYAYVHNSVIFPQHTLPYRSVTIEKPTKTDVERLQVALAVNKLEWFARDKVLRVIDKARANKGDRYWYLSEKLTIVSDRDMYTKRHDERHKNGNYFCSYGTAILFAQRVRSLRKEITGVQ